ncbi:conserved hypothetical protein [Ricinus communis]|uniref:DUF2510 domain-containing protein n=1 Tax=Ricinus communis TaxID=3988 RepID=B9TNQ1_RICCO|nr:conserved hypothetical protein [Ricinus communis]
MGHSRVTTASESHWNPPHTWPTAVGEYRSALEPANAGPGSRRWWNGKRWSRPYGVDWPEALKAKCRAESGEFAPYWLPNADGAVQERTQSGR